MPRLTLRLPESYNDCNTLVSSFEDAIVEAFGDGLLLQEVGTFIQFYDEKASRPCEPISATLVAIDKPGRREKLQGIVDKVLRENPEIKRFKPRDNFYIDLDVEWRQDEDWVAA